MRIFFYKQVVTSQYRQTLLYSEAKFPNTSGVYLGPYQTYLFDLFVKKEILFEDE